MTNVTIYKNSDTYLKISVIGHAGYDVSGLDIVCASVSVLTINTVNSIEKFTSDKITLVTDSNAGLIEFSFDDKPSKDSVLLIKSFELGILEISKTYSEYVKLDYKEV